MSSDAEARSFAETRRTLLDALDRTEQAAHDQAAQLIIAAERQAREITIKADQTAALIEEQVAYLTAQLDHVRGRMLDIRTRLAQDLQTQSDKRSPISRVAPQPPEPVAPPPLPAITLDSSSAHHPGGSGDNNESLPETLRVLRAALESLNGEASTERGTH